jgi:hypothetical protein
MRLNLSIPAAVMGLCLSFLASGEAMAATFTFTKIADTSGAFGGPFAPAINDEGTVVFEDQLDEVTRILTSDGTTTTTIAAEGDTGDFLATPGDFFSFFGGPVINNEGTVAFYSGLQLGGEGIFTSDGKTITNIAMGSFGSEVSINNKGIVAFVGRLAGGSTGIFTSDGTTTTTIADTNGPFIGFGFPSINDEGTVAFSASLEVGGGGIFTSDGTTTTSIADTNGSFKLFGDPDINDRGTLAFRAFLDERAEEGTIVISDGTTTTTIADNRGLFYFFDNPVINNRGMIAFSADLDTGGRGIFTGPDPVADKVIATGDSFFGSTVIQVLPPDLNNSGQIVFDAILADGTRGIYVATPVSEPTSVPEPASTFGLLAFGAFGAGSMLKRKRQKAAQLGIVDSETTD